MTAEEFENEETLMLNRYAFAEAYAKELIEKDRGAILGFFNNDDIDGMCLYLKGEFDNY